MAITLARYQTRFHQLMRIVRRAAARLQSLQHFEAPPTEALGAIGVVVSGALFFTLAQAAPAMQPRSLEADAIAATFAAGHSQQPDGQRLDFAPGLAMALRQAEAAPSITGDLSAPWGAGALVIRGLPRGSRLSAGLVFDDGTWVVSQGDLDGMVLTLAGPQPAALDVVLEVIGVAGTPERQLALSLILADWLAPDLPAFTSAQFGQRIASDIRTGALGQLETGKRRLRHEKAKARSQRTKPPRVSSAKRVKSVQGAVQSAAAPQIFKPASGAIGPPPASLFGSLPQPASSPNATAAPREAFPVSPMEREAARR